MLIINMGEIEMFRLHHAIMIRIKGTWSKIVFKRHHMRAIMKRRHMNQQPLPYQQHHFIDHDTVVLEVAAAVVESVVTAIKCAIRNNASRMATIIVVNSSQ